MDELYKEYILDHYRTPRNFGHLDNPDAVAEDVNPLCGDEIRMELRLVDGKVTDVRFSGKGCAISQASASMLTESIRGESLEDIATMSNERVLENVGIGISPTRMKCAMLGLKVLKSAAVHQLAAQEVPSGN
ncbi:MAG: SUF system NifU family Fe-S cluster assembly protein [Candidatus Eremiobacteraeota bacterium]|nr:SUF system NifU family Fe-S cluster assembly protein [Candidatus Eremiobacteraeota bacterium]